MEITVQDLYNFKQCPLRYKLGTEEPDGLREALLSTISYYYYNLWDGKQLTLTDLKEKFGSIWYGKMDLYDIKVDGDRKKRDQEIKAIGMLTSFHRQQKYSPDKVVAVNLDFRVPIGKDFFVRGKIPLIRETSRGMEIVNFKTGQQKYNEFWQRTDMDVTLQAMAFHGIYKKEADSIAAHILKDGQVYFLERKRSDYQRVYKSISMMKEAMDKGWFYPRESYLCDKCPVQNICMEWK